MLLFYNTIIFQKFSIVKIENLCKMTIHNGEFMNFYPFLYLCISAYQ